MEEEERDLTKRERTSVVMNLCCFRRINNIHILFYSQCTFTSEAFIILVLNMKLMSRIYAARGGKVPQDKRSGCVVVRFVIMSSAKTNNVDSLSFNSYNSL